MLFSHRAGFSSYLSLFVNQGLDLIKQVYLQNAWQWLRSWIEDVTNRPPLHVYTNCRLLSQVGSCLHAGPLILYKDSIA